MQWKNVELFNVEDLEPFSDGVILHRFSKDARKDTRDRSTWMASAANGCELRFVTEADVFWVTLGTVAQGVTIFVMCGDYFYEKYTLSAGEKRSFQFENTDFLAPYEGIHESRFSHKVWRFYFQSEGEIVYYGIRAAHGIVRPPYQEELPQKTMLAYGSSITHGCWAMDTRNSYIQQAAQRLRMDVLNKGMAGACRLEKSICDGLLGLKNWDLAFLELGVNVVNIYSTAQFEECAEYLVKNLCEKNPDKPVFLTGTYYNTRSLSKEHEKLDAFEEILRKIGSKYALSNLHYIDGRRIMDSTEYLSKDITHPSDYGHLRMGENLAAVLLEYGIKA